VVKRFGEAIFPALRHVESVLRGGDAPHHTLIEADNYHALQLLEWLYADKVDCIYIDPPYNTGARDWKYNNDFVDDNDSWRHSKWLSMMKRRISIAFRVLKPDGIMVITIDDCEVHRLKCLLADNFKEAEILGTLVIRNTPQARSTTKGFAIAHEYAVFVGRTDSSAIGRLRHSAAQLARYGQEDDKGAFEWVNFRKPGGLFTYRTARPKQFYPIYVTKSSLRIPRLEWRAATKDWKVSESEKPSETVVWPIDGEGNERVWSWGHETARQSIPEMTVRPDQSGNLGVYRKLRPNVAGTLPVSWWDNPLYSATEYGTNFLKRVFGESQVFPFPKSVYAVRDALRVAGGERRDALILDFFAGSGTTLNAVALLNESDGGARRCILVTNNEVSENEASKLRASGTERGDRIWEENGLCRSVTFPRCKFVINGKRDDGAELPGEYSTGRFEEQEARRAIRPLDFATVESLANKRAREALAAAIAFPKSKVMAEEPFLLAEGENVAVLLIPEALDEFIEKGEEWAGTVETVYLPFPSGKAFNQAKERLTEAWPPLIKTVEIKRPMKDGFVANLDYFRLDFLDRSLVETGGKLADILPALWMMAGGRGKLPTCRGNEKMLFFKDCPFAVLVDESAIKPFLARLEERPDVDWAFLVTNDQDSFSRMCEWLPEHIPAVQRVHLWRNYVDNFLINVDHASEGAAP